MSFGSSARDFIRVSKLIVEITNSLKDTGGAKSEYQELVRTLDCLRTALDGLDRLNPSEADSKTRNAIICAAFTCRYTLETFQSSIKKYDDALGLWTNERGMKSAVDKLRWTFQQRHGLSALQTTLQAHLEIINMLLAKYNQEKLDRISSEAESRQISVLERLESTEAKVSEIGESVKAQALAAQSNASILEKLFQTISGEFIGPWMFVADLVAKL